MKKSIKHTTQKHKQTENKKNQNHTHTHSQKNAEKAELSCVFEKVHRNKTITTFSANCVLCLVVVCREKIARAPISFFLSTSFRTNINQQQQHFFLLHQTKRKRTGRKKILFLLLVRGSVACAPAPARRKTGIYYYGCVFIILINNGKNSYYYTLEYMKQRLFGKNARGKFRSRVAESRKICSNTHTYTHTYSRKG